MDELMTSRQTIEEIDKEMAKLFEKRMDAAAKIAAYKREKGLAVKDSAREDALIEKNIGNIENPDYEGYYVNFLRNTIEISKRYQEKLLSGMKVAYSGAAGAFAYIAAKTLFSEAELICKHDFGLAYKSVENGECDCAVLPLENSYAGEVSTVLDMAFSGSLFINQVIDLPVKHCLLGLPGSDRNSIKKVISHPQALAQCGDYIERHGFTTKGFGNTALAAERVKEMNDPSVAAIASKETAEIMGLEILDENIQDSGINTTRFGVFSRSENSKKPEGRKDDEQFILVFSVKNEAGALAQTLNIIGAHGYNMRSLRSRPMKGLLWEYYFFIEAEGNINTENGQDMLRELGALCARLKMLGSYNTFNA